jgi:tetratricopeptide (TPR) repeat protein
MRRGWSLLLLLPLVVVGCAVEPKVPRVYGGRVIEGAIVPPEAYALYLRGVLAEEAGDLQSALAAYEATIKEDDEDPEPFTRIGDVRCRLDPKSRAADDAFAEAQAIDRTYAPLLVARARCAAARGQTEQAIALTEAVSKADRQSPQLEALYLSLATKRPARERAIALTVAAGEHVVAWEALIAWGRSHSEPELVARGLEGLLRVAPMRSRDIEAGALDLLGKGQLAFARQVAAAVADAPAELGVRNVHDTTVARLAVDEALVRGDLARAERRAVRGHVSRAEVAGRAALLEHAKEASALASEILRADPSDAGAAMVVGAPAKSASAPAPCAFAMAQRLPDEAARAFMAGVAIEPLPPHDPLGSALVDLAVRGVVADTKLSPELRLEVAARRRTAPPPIDPSSVDPRHALLFHSLVDPIGAPARALLAKLAPASDRDPLVAFALVRAAIASPPSDAKAVQAAIASAPADPLVLAAAVDLAKKTGKAEDVAPARARLMAVARTPAERALAEP